MKEQNDKNVGYSDNGKHYFADESEGCPDFVWKTDSTSVLTDIKVLMREHYFASFSSDGAALKLKFNNGQRFIIIVCECE